MISHCSEITFEQLPQDIIIPDFDFKTSVMSWTKGLKNEFDIIKRYHITLNHINRN